MTVQTCVLDTTNLVLTTTLPCMTGGLLQYVSQCRPWVGDRDRRLAEIIDTAARRQRDHIGRLAEIIQIRRLDIRPGSFPIRFAQYNDVSLRFLVPLLMAELRELVQSIELALSGGAVARDVCLALQAVYIETQRTLLMIGNCNITENCELHGDVTHEPVISVIAKLTPPSIDAIVQRRHELEDAIQRVAEHADQDLAHSGAGIDLSQVEADLQALSDRISELIELKNSGRFFDDIVESAFHMQHTVEQLRADHRQLLHELQDLREKLRCHPRKVRRLLHGWLVRFRELEHRESRMLQDTVYVDVGSID